MEKKFLTLPFAEFKQEDNTDEFYRFEGYLSTYNNVDLGDDIMMEGAFDKCLASKKPNAIKVLYQHDPYQPLGVYEELRSDKKGLFVKGKMPKDNTLVRDVVGLMKCGAIDSMSIGYSAINYSYNDNGKRLLKEVDLWEGSLVTFPMNQEAIITGMKKRELKFELADIQHIKTKRDFEKFLRDSGVFSVSAAKQLASYFLRDSNGKGVIEKQLTDIKDLINKLKGV